MTMSTASPVLQHSLNMLSQGTALLEEGDLFSAEHIFKALVSSLTQHLNQTKTTSSSDNALPAVPMVALPTAVLVEDGNCYLEELIASGSTVFESPFLVTWDSSVSASGKRDRAWTLTSGTCIYNLALTYQRQAQMKGVPFVHNLDFLQKAHQLYVLAWSAVKNVLMPTPVVRDDGNGEMITPTMWAPLDDASWLLLLAIGMNARACAQELEHSHSNDEASRGSRWMQAVGGLLEMLEPGPLSQTQVFQFFHLVWFCSQTQGTIAAAAA